MYIHIYIYIYIYIYKCINNDKNHVGFYSPLVLGGSVKVNHWSENRRFGLDVRVGGSGGKCHVGIAGGTLHGHVH